MIEFISFCSNVPFEALTPEQRPAWLAHKYGCAMCEVGKEHFRYLTTVDSARVTQTLEALVVVGAETQHRLLEEAQQRFGAGTPSHGYGDLDEAYYFADPPLHDHVDAYLQGQLDQFVILEDG